MLSYPPSQHLTLQDEHGAALADYFYYAADELLYVHWHGQLTGDAIIRGVGHGTAWRDQLHYSLILNDKSDTGGDWSDALPWLQYEWLPLAVDAGVRAMAYVFSPDTENRFASHDFVTAVRPRMAIELFDDLDTALAWLLSQHEAQDISSKA
ncbi:MAG TPA: hypothetical protein VF629_11445 [Hymenobacter sp.]|jgi:hypothetical protein|uniref:hypothetical protein n=1 Tax=Hymenobacter sp. TaxID=1898978 RepID=UPI002EDB2804